MSFRTYRPTYYGAEVKTRDAAGLIFAFRDSANYMMLTVDQGYFFLIVIKDGAVSLASRDGKLPLSRVPFQLSVRKAGHSFVVFQDQNAVAVIEKTDSLEGALGVCDFRLKPSGAWLSEPVVSEFEQAEVVRPAFKLKTFK